MSSLHQSRVRVLFDATCAFGVSASCVVAWMETYAPAMLPIAGIAGIWGFVRLFDIRRWEPAVAGESEPLPIVDPVVAEVPVPAWAPVVEFQPEADPEPIVEAVTEPKTKPARKSTRAKAARAKAVPVPESVSAGPEVSLVGTARPPFAAEESPAADAPAELDYAPVTPLFEAEPFVRQQRAAFGRRKFG